MTVMQLFEKAARESGWTADRIKAEIDACKIQLPALFAENAGWQVPTPHQSELLNLFRQIINSSDATKLALSSAAKVMDRDIQQSNN